MSMMMMMMMMMMICICHSDPTYSQAIILHTHGQDYLGTLTGGVNKTELNVTHRFSGGVSYRVGWSGTQQQMHSARRRMHASDWQRAGVAGRRRLHPCPHPPSPSITITSLYIYFCADPCPHPPSLSIIITSLYIYFYTASASPLSTSTIAIYYYYYFTLHLFLYCVGFTPVHIHHRHLLLLLIHSTFISILRRFHPCPHTPSPSIIIITSHLTSRGGERLRQVSK